MAIIFFTFSIIFAEFFGGAMSGNCGSKQSTTVHEPEAKPIERTNSSDQIQSLDPFAHYIHQQTNEVAILRTPSRANVTRAVHRRRTTTPNASPARQFGARNAGDTHNYQLINPQQHQSALVRQRELSRSRREQQAMMKKRWENPPPPLPSPADVFSQQQKGPLLLEASKQQKLKARVDAEAGTGTKKPYAIDKRFDFDATTSDCPSPRLMAKRRH